MHFRATHFVGLAAAVAALLFGQHLATAQTTPGDTALAQTPLFVSDSYPPLNMLVMGRDHKLYYEAYNDASDLDGDGVIDVGYKPDTIDYYGYFNNNACYSHSADTFKPTAVATGTKKKQCDGTTWSGDFLNYLTTSRMDAMRRVLYGGMRVTDTAASTVLQASFIPRDAHSWGKAYDPARDLATYDIAKYAPLGQPVANTRHLFAVTTTAQSGDGAIPVLRVLNDSKFQIWEWVSKEQPVAQNNCIDNNTSCERGAASDEFSMLPSSAFQDLTITTWKFNTSIPGNAADMSSRFTTFANTANLCGSGTISAINITGGNNNPYNGINGCTHEHYLTQIDGKVYIPAAGNYTFAIDGDDAVELQINGSTLGWYGGHGSNRSQGNLQTYSKQVYFDSAGWKTLRFRHVEGTGDDNWGLALKASYPKSAIVDKKIRVEACSSTNADLREATCKPYPNSGGTTIYKPTGLLHDFGENEKMYFGLLTGSYQKNIAGGTLRRNMSKFTDEVDLQTGQFKAGVNGVVANIDRQQAIGFNGSSYSNCPHITDGPISGKPDPSNCAMWGNPIGEMMFETMRYFAGATGAHADFKYGNGSKDEGLKLSNPDWEAPYKPKSTTGEKGGGYQHCARPVMTVLSDINPSYDFKLPGSRYQSIAASADALSGFNVATEVQAIGTAEGIHGKNFFIGQSTAGNADTAPSVKRVDDLSWVRGLSPQEPSKEGTYNSAGVSRFAANNAIFGNAKGKNRLMTYAVAIASPLPEIRFPVGTTGNYVTIAPFAKSVTGNSIDATKFAPTNQIVDYYVDRIANTGKADQNLLINAGRPYAEFRINYEDVEQGADHDMDAISRYTVALQADNTIKIDMVSEYAAGGIGQHMGYVISGTSQDGMYLEVHDKDTASVFYSLNTPPGRAPGYCVGRSTEAECQNLPLTASRTFTPSTTSTSGSFLKDPLWYAAKYGMPGRDPATVLGDPDNYFLVTNATTLKEKMTKAFNDILQNNNSVTAVSVTVPEGTIAAGADIYRTRFEAEGWVGDVIREKLTESTTGLNYVRQWSAAEKLAARMTALTPRKILYPASGTATPQLRPFTYAAISAQPADAHWLTALNTSSASIVDGKAEQRIAFLRGESETLRKRKKLTGGQPIVLGDIVNSSPLRVAGAMYRGTAADALEGTGSNYASFITGQASKPAMIYVGANDGMLHAFRADNGEEEFAYIPSALRTSLNVLTASDYGAKDGTPHRYFVDGTPVASDVYFGGAWHKVLIGSLGAGGKQIFALDITDPAAPKLLWEFGVAQNSDMGNSLAQPTIARLNDPATGKGKWVALVPNGYQGGSSSTGGANLFVLDIANGSVLKKFDLDGGMTAAEVTASQPLGNGLSRALGVDGNRDGKVDVAYAGDLAGNMWRFDLRSGNSAAWTAQKLYTARDTSNARQPITAAPYVVEHPMGRGDLVIFGTGRLLTVSDKSNAQKQTIYGIWDRYSNEATVPAPLPTANKGRANLQSQTFTELATDSGNFGLSSNVVQWFKTNATGTRDADVEKWGWVVDLPRNGEKMTYDMTLYGRGLFLSTVRTSDDPCAAGLSGTLYAMDPNGGGKTDYVPFDMNGDGSFNATDAINGNTVSGTQTGAGKQTIRAGRVFDPNANAERRVNSGLEFGRQNWRRQPPN
ncbi:MAG: fimbrial assembly protein [Variovorax sp.]|nr:MAG: fimbrial assembly protein [Variovorax sp.]